MSCMDKGWPILAIPLDIRGTVVTGHGLPRRWKFLYKLSVLWCRTNVEHFINEKWFTVAVWQCFNRSRGLLLEVLRYIVCQCAAIEHARKTDDGQR